MTREEYLYQLKTHLTPLTLEEQAEALQYYSDYFEECSNDQKVMDELGTPEELAKTIVDNFANALVSKESSSRNDESSRENYTSPQEDDISLYYEFPKENVRSLHFNFTAADIMLISGNKYSVETRGIEKQYMECSLSNDGILTIKNNTIFNFGFFSRSRLKRIVPRILLTVPADCNLDSFKITLGAGNFRTKEVNIKCHTGNLDVGAGNLVIRSVHGGNISYRCGMGNITFEGSVEGNSSIDCGMGNISLNLTGRESDFSYDAKVGLGDFKLNGEKRSGVGQSISTEKKSNHFHVNCGMGSVNIHIGQ